MPGTTGRGNGAAEDGGELNRIAAHAARPALDQDLLARLKARVVDKCLPGGQRRKRQGGRLGMRERPRPGRELGGGQRYILRRRPVTIER